MICFNVVIMNSLSQCSSSSAPSPAPSLFQKNVKHALPPPHPPPPPPAPLSPSPPSSLVLASTSILLPVRLCPRRGADKVDRFRRLSSHPYVLGHSLEWFLPRSDLQGRRTISATAVIPLDLEISLHLGLWSQASEAGFPLPPGLSHPSRFPVGLVPCQGRQ